MASNPDVPPPAGGLCTAVVGLQWGDEGKGKVVDLIAPRFDAVVRYNGGANAGHSVVVKGERYALHLMPSGILYPGKLAVIGNGVVVDPEVLLKEVDGLNSRGVDTSGLVVSDRAHVVMPYHKAEDDLREQALAARYSEFLTGSGSNGGGNGGGGRSGGGGGGGSIGTTKRGIGPCYADKAQRATAIRVGDLARPALLRQKLEMACAIKNPILRGLGGPAAPQFDPAELAAWAQHLGIRLGPSIRDTTYLLHDMRASKRPILFEGANAALLDVDHGTFPFVTSSSCTALGIPAGTGVPGSQIGEVIGVVKAYSTRVGNGPLPTELLNDTGEQIRRRGREYGTTTGRPRRVGWLDLVAVRYSAMLSGATSLAVTLLDVLSGLSTLRVCTRYQIAGPEAATELTTIDRFLPDAEQLASADPVYLDLPGFDEDITAVRSRADLPANAKAYLDLIEKVVGVPIGLIGVGPERDQTIVCR